MTDADQTRGPFSWEDIGDVAEGRPNLGQSVPVSVYRLMQFSLKDALLAAVGPETAGRVFVEAGRVAGREFYHHDLGLAPGGDFSAFVAALQRRLRELSVGILRLERADPETMEMTLTVAEDLDCSGLPVSDETVCSWDEGFFAGILEAHTGRRFSVREVDCWASGERVCRFRARPGDGA